MVVRILMDLFLLAGAYFALAGTIGTLNMPDTFSRMQASTCVSTLGILGICIGGLLYAIFVMHSASTSIKIVVIAALILCTNPVGSHTIAKGAYKAGIRPEKTMEVDDMRRDFDE